MWTIQRNYVNTAMIANGILFSGFGNHHLVRGFFKLVIEYKHMQPPRAIGTWKAMGHRNVFWEVSLTDFNNEILLCFPCLTYWCLLYSQRDNSLSMKGFTNIHIMKICRHLYVTGPGFSDSIEFRHSQWNNMDRMQSGIWTGAAGCRSFHKIRRHTCLSISGE